MIYLEVIDEAIQETAVSKAVQAVESIDRPMTDHLRLKMAAEFAVQLYAEMQNELGFQPYAEVTE